MKNFLNLSKLLGGDKPPRSELTCFSPNALEAIRFAEQEARRMRRGYISAEHLLLGVAGVSGFGFSLLKKRGLGIEFLRAKVENFTGLGRAQVDSPIFFTPEAKKIFGTAVIAAKDFRCAYVGTEHLLFALAHDKEVAGHLLAELQVTVDDLKQELQSPC